MNPIHHDAAFALRAGYPEPFAVGMRQAGVLAAYATDWFGPESIRRFKVRFHEQACQSCAGGCARRRSSRAPQCRSVTGGVSIAAIRVVLL
jgi:hypothetical protein